MNQENYAIKMNVVNYLRTLITSTFKDPLSFLDEIFQNADRSDAKNVYVNFETIENKLIIENDGEVLNNPQKLFSMSESGWKKEVMDTENPFGIGFFSVFTVSKKVEVFTGKKHIIIDIEKILEANDPSLIETLETVEHYNGFKLVLNDIEIDNINDWSLKSSIKERVEMLGKYIQAFDTYWHKNKIEKKKLTEGDGSVFLLEIDEGELFQGWLALSDDFVSEGLKIFYKGRFVKKLEDMYYIKGDLHITDKALNLTAPDRKDIKTDSKLYKFKEIIRDYVELLCEEAITNGKQSDIDNYANVLSFYSNKQKLKSKMKFKVFKGKEKEDMDYLSGVAIAIKNKGKEEITSLSEYEVYLRNGSEIQSESHFEEISIEPKNLKPVPKTTSKDSVEDYFPSSSSISNYSKKNETKKVETRDEKGEIIFSNEEPTFWLTFDEIEQHQVKFNIVKHYNLKLVVTRNKFEIEVLKNMESENVFHIDKLKEKVKVEASLSNTYLSKKEQRGLMILDMVSRMAGYDRNIFAIGDLLVTKTTVVEAINESFVSIDTEVVAINNTENQKIYVDRSCVNSSMLEESLHKTLTIQDLQFVLANLKDIVSEISLMDFKDKEQLYKKIFSSLSNANTIKNEELAYLKAN